VPLHALTAVPLAARSFVGFVEQREAVAEQLALDLGHVAAREADRHGQVLGPRRAGEEADLRSEDRRQANPENRDRDEDFEQREPARTHVSPPPARSGPRCRRRNARARDRRAPAGWWR